MATRKIKGLRARNKLQAKKSARFIARPSTKRFTKEIVSSVKVVKGSGVGGVKSYNIVLKRRKRR